MAHGSSNSRGVAILVKKDVDCTIHSKILDPSGQFVIIKTEMRDKMYVLINIYAPNLDASIANFLNNLLVTQQKNSLDEEENIIMGGDFNWIGSLRENKSTPFGIKWTNEPVKALDVCYSYDQKLLHEKNFIERLDSVKKLINLWSARGLSRYGKITVIKSLIIPKFVYIASLLTTPKGVIQELNRLIFKFLCKGVDKVTRLSTINNYQRSG